MYGESSAFIYVYMWIIPREGEISTIISRSTRHYYEYREGNTNYYEYGGIIIPREEDIHPIIIAKDTSSYYMYGERDTIYYVYVGIISREEEIPPIIIAYDRDKASI